MTRVLIAIAWLAAAGCDRSEREAAPKFERPPVPGASQGAAPPAPAGEAMTAAFEGELAIDPSLAMLAAPSPEALCAALTERTETDGCGEEAEPPSCEVVRRYDAAGAPQNAPSSTAFAWLTVARECMGIDEYRAYVALRGERGFVIGGQFGVVFQGGGQSGGATLDAIEVRDGHALVQASSTSSVWDYECETVHRTVQRVIVCALATSRCGAVPLAEERRTEHGGEDAVDVECGRATSRTEGYRLQHRVEGGRLVLERRSGTAPRTVALGARPLAELTR